LVSATRKGLAECARELAEGDRARLEKALQTVETVLEDEHPEPTAGDTRQLLAACAELDEASVPLADLLMDKATDALLRQRGLTG
jgi:hypothetical protein